MTLYSVFRPIFGCAAVLALSLILWKGGGENLRQELTLGSLMAFIFYLKMLFAPLDDLAEKFNVFQGFAVASERVFRILDTEVEPGSIPFEQRQPAAHKARGIIEFRDVHFAYSPDKPVLKGISLKIEAGQSIALVGPTGSGKTTLAALLTRTYPLTGESCSGEILLDDKRIEDWDLHHLRSQIGLVSQDLFLFRASLAHNLTLFAEAGDEKLATALRVSRADTVAARLPEGLQTPLGERGAQLSQGERQLVSFARALVGDPPVMILDEATSSIDSLTEQAIQAALSELLRGRTSLVVAHRLSTIRQCDRILVLEKGEIIESGNHEELMAAAGLYAQLYRAQLLEEELRHRHESHPLQS